MSALRPALRCLLVAPLVLILAGCGCDERKTGDLRVVPATPCLAQLALSPTYRCDPPRLSGTNACGAPLVLPASHRADSDAPLRVPHGQSFDYAVDPARATGEDYGLLKMEIPAELGSTTVAITFFIFGSGV